MPRTSPFVAVSPALLVNQLSVVYPCATEQMWEADNVILETAALRLSALNDS